MADAGRASHDKGHHRPLLDPEQALSLPLARSLAHEESRQLHHQLEVCCALVRSQLAALTARRRLRLSVALASKPASLPAYHLDQRVQQRASCFAAW